MTESEFEKIEEFKTLPIYDENSPYCREIERPSDVKYTGEIIEVTTIEEAYDLSVTKIKQPFFPVHS